MLRILELLNYGLVFLFGLLLSVGIAGGLSCRRERWLTAVLCPLLLLVQGLFMVWGGVDAVERWYPLITHLPLVLFLTVFCRRPFGVSVISVATAYLCCQLPRWVQLALAAATGSAPAGEIGYLVAVILFWLLLSRYFVRPAHDAITVSRRSLWLFGSLPAAYYCFDYATVVYTDLLYTHTDALNEFLPTVLTAFYVIFLTAYHVQAQRRAQAELQRSMLEAELKQSGTEIENLRHTEIQTAVYRHDMRHHLNAIGVFLEADNPQAALAYIQSVRSGIEAITPRRFCENELVNLLCTSFDGKAKRMGIELAVEAALPAGVPLADTELCALISNGLENALRAAGECGTGKRVSVYIAIKRSRLLVEIKNPYSGEIAFRDGLPLAARDGHGYGCRSIRTIAEQTRGICEFSAESGIFTLRVVIPVP